MAYSAGYNFDDFELDFTKDVSVPVSFDLHLLLKASQTPDYDFTDVRGFGLAGHSVNAHIDIKFNGSLNKGTIEAGQSVFLIPLKTNPLAENLDQLELTSNPAFIDLEAEGGPFDTAKYASQRIRATAISLDNGEENVLRITPLEPLEPQTKYLVLITSEVRDSTNASTGPSEVYKGLVEEALGNPLLESIQNIVQLSNTLGELWLANQGADTDITLAYTLTTANTETVFNSIAAPATYLETLGQQIVVYSALQKARELIEAEIAAGELPASDLTANKIFARVQAALAKTGEEAAADPIVQAVGPYIQNPALIEGIVSAAVPTLPFPKPRTARFYNHQDATDLPFIPVDTENQLNQAASAVKVAEGAIELPYYLDIPNPAVAASVNLTIGGKWSGSTTLEDTINDQIDTLRDSNPALTNLPSFAFPRDADGETFNVTQYMPFPEQKGSVAVPVTVFYPNTGCATSSGSGITDVVIFQHGITVDRSVAALPAINMAAQTLGTNCVATVAIDQPLHGLAGGPLPGTLPGLTPISDFGDISGDFADGTIISERHFMATRDNDADGFAATFADTLADVESGSLFLNLVSPETARDNIRQAVLDLLNLSATANFAKVNPMAFNFVEGGTVDLSSANFHFVGHSLGGISGLPFAALSKDPTVRGSYAALGTENFPLGAFFADLDSMSLMNTGGQLTRIVENSGAFSQVALPALDAAGFSQGTSQFENFMYIFQSVVDDIDPVNYAKRLGDNLGTDSLLISSVVGDLTVPNEANVNPLDPAKSSPLTGTEPLMALLNLGSDGSDLVDSSIVDSTLGAPTGLVSSFFDGTNPCTDANHSTFVAPIVPADSEEPDPICPNGSNTSDAFAQMIAQVIGNITDAGIPGGDRLSPSPTIEQALDQDEQ